MSFDAVAAMRRVAEIVAAHRIGVVYSDGWERRGNGSAWIPEGPLGHVNHHTAGGNNIYIDNNLITGVPGLSGPLCNFCIMFDGDLGLIAAHPANHAGASGGWDTAPLPVTNDFNRRVWGTEIQYRAQDNPMSDPQYRTMCVLNAAMVEVQGWPGDFSTCKNHQGTSVQGKWDPGYPPYPPGTTYDIVSMRRDFAAVRGGGDESGGLDMPEAQEILHQETGSPQVGQFPGWETRRFQQGEDPRSFTQTDYLREIDREINGRLPVGDDNVSRPVPPDRPDTILGHVLSLRAEVAELREIVERGLRSK